jgi:hypothetical protein
MKSKLLPFLIAVAWFQFSCTSTKSTAGKTGTQYNSSSFSITEISTDPTYGFTEKNPIHVGGVKESMGPSNQRRFLDALLGPNGQELTYVRRGSCCHFKTENGLMGGGLLDMYEIKWKGLEKPVVLYLNLYDYGPLKAPVGFTIK